MPQVPSINNYSVTPQVTNITRVGAESFGAGTWKQIGEAGAATERIGIGLESINYLQTKTLARGLLNQYHEMVNKGVNDIESDPSNYLTAPQKIADVQEQAKQSIRDQLGKNYQQVGGIIDPLMQDHDAVAQAHVMNWTRQTTEKVGIENDKGAARIYLSENKPDAAFDAFNKIGTKLGYVGDGLQDFKNDQANKYLARIPVEQLKQGLDTVLSAKDGVSPEFGEQLKAQYLPKVLTADGKVASKDANNSIDKTLADAQENSTVLARMSYDDIDKASIGASQTKRKELIEAKQNVDGGKPIGRIEEDNQRYLKQQHPDLFNGESLNADGMQAWSVYREKLHALKPDEQKDPKEWTKIADSVMKQTGFIDENGINYGHAYQVPANAGTYRDGPGGGYIPGVGQTSSPFDIQHTHSLPRGSVSLTEYNIPGKGMTQGSFAMVPEGGQYKVMDLESGKTVDFRQIKKAQEAVKSQGNWYANEGTGNNLLVPTR